MERLSFHQVPTQVLSVCVCVRDVCVSVWYGEGVVKDTER